MAYILHIETATKNCSVSLAKDGQCLAIKELNNGQYSHAEVLHPFIEDVLSEAGLAYSSLDAIAVSKGPGSYTGLRIGVSAAKGLCYAMNIPLISVDTLSSLATNQPVEAGHIIPMIDARRMEVYAAVFDHTGQQVRKIQADIVTEATYQSYLDQGKVTFWGDGAAKCKEVIDHPNAVFIADQHPSARELCALAYAKFLKNDVEDVAYFEPFYLKDFIAVPEKKK